MNSQAFAGLPPHGRGQRIGLFGGSFNPPHEGHRAASLLALHRLGLDKVWWLVSPGNPLKDTSGLPPVSERLAAACAVAAHPRIAVSAFEEGLGSPYTCDMVAAVARRAPGVKFVLLMGADAFADFHRWKQWQRIAGTLPLGVIDRPGSTLRAARSKTADVLAADRLPGSEARCLAECAAPAWIFLQGRRSRQSSTALRGAD